MEKNVFNEVFSDPEYDQLNNLHRWNGLSRNKEETVAQHSFIVVFFTRILLEYLLKGEFYKFKYDTLSYAEFHDFDEIVTGDLNHEVKYNSYNGHDLRLLLKQYCDFSFSKKFKDDNKFNNMMKTYLLHDVGESIKSIVKIADWLSMAFYIKKEIRLGNRNLSKEFDNCQSKLRQSCKRCEMLMIADFGKDFDNKILKQITEINFKNYE